MCAGHISEFKNCSKHLILTLTEYQMHTAVCEKKFHSFYGFNVVVEVLKM